jgi:hypothetical protein
MLLQELIAREDCRRIVTRHDGNKSVDGSEGPQIPSFRILDAVQTRTPRFASA